MQQYTFLLFIDFKCFGNAATDLKDQFLAFAPVSATPGTSSMSKRPRDEEESTSIVTDTETPQEDTSRAPIPKKLRIIQRVGPEVRNGVA